MSPVCSWRRVPAPRQRATAAESMKARAMSKTPHVGGRRRGPRSVSISRTNTARRRRSARAPPLAIPASKQQRVNELKQKRVGVPRKALPACRRVGSDVEITIAASGRDSCWRRSAQTNDDPRWRRYFRPGIGVESKRRNSRSCMRRRNCGAARIRQVSDCAAMRATRAAARMRAHGDAAQRQSGSAITAHAADLVKAMFCAEWRGAGRDRQRGEHALGLAAAIAALHADHRTAATRAESMPSRSSSIACARTCRGW